MSSRIAGSWQLLVLAGLASAASVQGARLHEFAELVPASANPGWFGEVLELRGTTAIVAAPCELPEGASGAVYVYELDGDDWIPVQRITSPLGLGRRRFGTSVDLQGDALAVGAPLETVEETEGGSVYVFRRGAAGQFVFETRLIAEIPAPTSRFGWDVALSPDGELLVVGAWLEGGSGATYVFRHTAGGWSLVRRLVPSSAPFLGEFGLAVETDGRQVFVGAPHNGDRFANGGAVFVFDRAGGNWPETARLEPHDLDHFWEFGYRLDLEAGRLLVGSPGADGVLPDSGKAYVFEGVRGAWQEASELVPAEGSTDGRCGNDVALSEDGTLAALGSLHDARRGFYAGAIHVFRDGGRGWRELAEAVPHDAMAGEELCRVALHADLLLAGAAGHAHPLPDGGGAWSFRIREPLSIRSIR